MERRDIETTLTFLKRTRDGRYAEIEESSLAYARLEVLVDDTEYLEYGRYVYPYR